MGSGILVNYISHRLPYFAIFSYRDGGKHYVTMLYKWKRCINDTKIQAVYKRLTAEDWNTLLNRPIVNDAC